MESATPASLQVELCLPTGLEVVVPIVDILAFDLDVDELDTLRRTMRNHTRKWQLSSDDHSRILRLMSETLDEQVAAAVRNSVDHSWLSIARLLPWTFALY